MLHEAKYSTFGALHCFFLVCNYRYLLSYKEVGTFVIFFILMYGRACEVVSPSLVTVMFPTHLLLKISGENCISLRCFFYIFIVLLLRPLVTFRFVILTFIQLSVICLKVNDDIFFCFNSENGKGAQAGRIKTALNNVRPYINVKIYAKCQVKCEKWKPWLQLLCYFLLYVYRYFLFVIKIFYLSP